MNIRSLLNKLFLSILLVSLPICGCAKWETSPEADLIIDWYPKGKWFDATQEWFVEFDDGKYRDSKFNVWRDFTFDYTGFKIEDPTGDVIDVDYVVDSTGVILDWYDGTYCIKQCSDQEWSEHLFFPWTASAIVANVVSRYHVLSGRFASSTLTLYDDDQFECDFCFNGDTFWYQGKYILKGTALYLIYNGGDQIDELNMYPTGVAGFPLEGVLEEVDVNGKTRLIGHVYDDMTDIDYAFDSNDDLIKTLSSGDTLSYYYDIDHGIVTVHSNDNADVTDRMYYDDSTLTLYRLVYEYSDWNSFMFGGIQ